ncbi:MAG: thiamine phosphate synthase [Candidatus Omnitrophota bacterium]
MKSIKDGSLYLVLTGGFGGGRDVLEIAGLAVSGGVDIIQMREKGKTPEELADSGNKLSGLCRANGVIFIVNDDPFLAKRVNADGVHLGQEDIEKYPLDMVREIVGKDRMIGLSTHSVPQFEEANKSDVDYIAFGPVFPTETKNYNVGTGDIQKVLSIADKPVVFIGGIDQGNVDMVLGKGARNIAVIRAIMRAEDIISAVREFKKKINSYAKKNDSQDKR